MTAVVNNSSSGRWTALGLFLFFFLPFLPAIPWTEFSGGMENFNVGTAQEMARNGNWLIPTLNGEVRTKKPPLATWMSAVGIKLTRSLPWGARLPNVLSTGLLAVATYYFGREIGGHRLGVISALVGGSSYLVLQHAIPAQYDMPFAVCITLTNLYLAKLALRGCWWEGCLGAGFWLGMALMVKGPPALLMTLLPFAVFLFIPEENDGASLSPVPTPVMTPVLAVLAGLVVLALVALPWTLYILNLRPDRIQEWYNETTLRDERLFEEHSWPLKDRLRISARCSGPVCCPWWQR